MSVTKKPKHLPHIHSKHKTLDGSKEARFHNQLISAVRDYELIYNPDHHFFHQASKTRAAWNEIAKRINSKPKKCRTHWTLLISYYKKLKKKIKAKGGGMVDSNVRWQHFDAMSFMDKYDGVKSAEDNMQEFDNAKTIYKEILDSDANEVDMESNELSEADSAISESLYKYKNNKNLQDSKTERTCSHFFALLGAKIDEINCPPGVRYNLEKNITDLVYDLLETSSS